MARGLYFTSAELKGILFNGIYADNASLDNPAAEFPIEFKVFEASNHDIVGFYLVQQLDTQTGHHYIVALTAAVAKAGVKTEFIVATNKLLNEKLIVFNEDLGPGGHLVEPIFAPFTVIFLTGEIAKQGYDLTDLEFLSENNPPFEQSFIGFHDLRSMVERNKSIAITGSKVISRSVYEDDIEEFFTYKFEGFNPDAVGGVLAPLTKLIGERPNPKQISGDQPIHTPDGKLVLWRSFPTRDGTYVSSDAEEPAEAALREAAVGHSVPESTMSSPCPPRWRRQKQ